MRLLRFARNDLLIVLNFDPSTTLRTGFLVLSFEFGGFWFVAEWIKRQCFGVFFLDLRVRNGYN